MRYRRYPSDLTDAQWALVVSHIPSAKSGGHPRTTDVRAVLDANATSWSMSSAFRSPAALNQPICRTDGLAADCWPGSRRSGRPFALSLQRLAMRAGSSLDSSDATDGVCGSSSVNSEPSRSLVSPGLLNAASPGLASIAACRKTTSAMSKHQRHCWTSLQSA